MGTVDTVDEKAAVKRYADRYETSSILGGGGTATVYRGKDLRLGRDVAVKVFREDVDTELRRIQSELEILASLNHPNLVSLYDAGEDPQAFLVLELVEGTTLTQRIRTQVLTPQEVCSLGMHLAAGLAYAHQAGVVHRDVKPSNVLLGESGPKLTDFGVAQLEDQAGVTQTGMTVGTAPYLSPEQVLGQRATPCSDVYSLALTLLEALTGKRSYEGGGVEAAIARLHADPLIPSDLPEGLASILERMTRRDPAERPTANEVHEALKELVSVEATQTHLVLPAPETERLHGLDAASRETPVTQARKQPVWPFIVALVVLVIAIVGVSYALTRDSAPPPQPPVSSQYEQPLRDVERLVQP